MQAYDYRSQARWALKGKWKVMIGIMLLAQVVLSGLGLGDIVQMFFSQNYVIDGAALGFEQAQVTYALPTGFGWVLYGLGQLVVLFSSVVYVGMYRVCNTVLNDGWPDWRQLFPMRLVWKAVAMNIVRTLLVALQLLLFVVPGIIALFRYSMADYLLAENPELGPVQALKESGRQLKGNKMRLFCLQLSFYGWMLLASIVPMGAILLLAGLPSWLLVAVELVLTWLCSCTLQVYMYTAETAFYNDLLHGSAKRAWREAGREDFGNAQPNAEEQEKQREEYARKAAADEAAAKEMFLRNKCSREKMRSTGVIDAYEALNPSRISEERWKRDYAQLLMRRFDRDESALDDLLALCAEYAMDDLADRVLMRIDRHIRQETLPCEAILNMAGRMLAMLLSGAFAGNEGFVGRKKADIAAMADRLEEKLTQENPEGEWRQAMQLIRRMCEG